jgi:hypothetical protein
VTYGAAVNIRILAAVPLLLALAACGSSSGNDPDVVEQGAKASAAATSDSTESETAAAEEPDGSGQLLESGFGQSDQYAVAMVLAKNTADHGGQMVTVTVNFLDAAGTIITTANQVESFTHAGQTIALQVFADLGNKRTKAASIEPTLLVEDEGTFSESDVEFRPVDSTEIRSQYGAFTPKIPLVNPTSDPQKDLRIGIVCRDASGTINGGGVDYPDLLPPGGTIVLEPSVTVSGKPVTCTAYPSAAGF